MGIFKEYTLNKEYWSFRVWRGSTRVPRRRQYCLRGSEAITGVGPRGSCAVPASPTGHAHAGPRRSEREGLESRVVGVRGNLRRV